MKLSVFAALAFILVTPSPSARCQVASLAPTEPVTVAPVTNAPLDKKMVWAHSMVDYPLDLNVLSHSHTPTYGDFYPLDQQFGLEQRTGQPWQALDIKRAQQAGIDGFAIDIFNNADQAIAYLNAADKSGGFLIAACLDLSLVPKAQKEDVAYRTIARYCDLAASHPSAARVNGAFVIDTYGTEQLPTDAWTRVRQRLAAAGYKTYWVVSVDSGFLLRKMKVFPADNITQTMVPFEAGYLFEAPGPWWPNVVTLFAQINRQFMGGIKPGYYRYNGLDIDPEGTARYRRAWEQGIQSNLNWDTISTWNDLGETTAVMPWSDWNYTREDITRWYSATFKHEGPPFSAPRLYVTSPKTTYPGKTLYAEALVLNPTARPVNITVQLVDGSGKTVGSPASGVAMPASDGAATVRLTVPSSMVGGFYRAKAEAESGGAQIAAEIGTPILVLDPEAQDGYGTTAYSVPAARTLPGHVGLHAIRDTSGKLTAVEPIVPAGVTPHFVEILHNTSLVSNVIDGPAAAIPVPAHMSSGQPIGKTEWGFYVARVTDGNLRVGYSDPIYDAPPKADFSVRDDYVFDAGAGTTVADRSPFKRAGVIVNGTWVTPGPDGQPACLGLNGATSRVTLATSATPDGPLRIDVTVRPHDYGGVIFGDTGGLLVSLDSQGRIVYSRVVQAGKAWQTAVGQTPLPKDAWSHVECDWDGTTMKVLVNGMLCGQAPCAAGFASYSRAIGCNCFGLSSDYFHGDIASFKITLFPEPERPG